MLSHDINRGITNGYAKGTSSSDMVESIRHLRACVLQIGNPLLLPMIIFSHDVSNKTEIKQREARDWLRKLEHAVSMRTEIQENEGYVKDGVVDLDAVNRDLVECHSQVLWKRPKAYIEILAGIEKGLDDFEEMLPERRKDETMRKLYKSMKARMEFYRVKLQGIDSYAYTTLQRLDIQRAAVSLFITLFFRFISSPKEQVANKRTSSTTSSRRKNPSLISKWLANNASWHTLPNAIPQL